MTGSPRPPRLAEWLLRRLLPRERQSEAIRGDLLEEYRQRFGVPPAFAKASAGRRARRFAVRAWYWREALSLITRSHGYRKMLTLDNLRQDLRFAWRSYAKAPAFTALVVGTIAMGIGASTAIFSIVNGILLRPLPFPEPERLMWINETIKNGSVVSVSWMNYQDWHARLQSFETLTASRGATYNLTGFGQAKPLPGRTVTHTFFRALGTQPFLGRDFTEADDRPGAEGTVIVSHEFWRRELSADPAALGRTVMLSARPYTIVGVMPPGFRYLRDYDVFVAMGAIAGAPWLTDRGNHQGFVAIGRLKPGVTREAAARELAAVEADLTRQYPASNAGLGTIVDPLAARLVEQVRETLLVLFGAVGLLLLIACVNVANLLISRGSARRHELAVRAALGGSRTRLLPQLLVESTLLSAAGGAAGLALAAALLRVLIAVAPAGTPRLDEVSLDGTALLFAIAAAAACGLLFGALPAAQASGASGTHAFVNTRPGGASAATHRLRRGLLVVEVALAIVLLTGAGLMARTLVRLMGVDAGFKVDHLLTLRVAVPEVKPDDERRTAVMNDVVTRIRALPGVVTVAAGYSIPIDGSNWNSSFTVQDKPAPASRGDLPSGGMIPISEAYFDALGTRIVRGRAFAASDAKGAPVAIVNETLARRIWPGEDPIGKRLKQGWPETPNPWREVVGVVEDIRFEGIVWQTTMQVYMPFAQDPPADFSVLVRTAVPPASITGLVENEIAAVNRDMPVSARRTMEEILGQSIARERMALIVLGVFAVVALMLAAGGLYGLVAHSVTERTHEIGVRMALGAARNDVIRLVVVSGLSMTVAGVVIGVAGAAALSNTLEELVFGVDPLDPATFAAVIVMLFAVALVACCVPALRATRIAPTTALRL